MAGLAVGGGEIGLPEVWRSFGSRCGIPVEPLTPLADSVIWELRMPRVLLAALAGAALACSGSLLQAVTGNPLAEPSLLGISSGASTGAVLILILGFAATTISLTAGALMGGVSAFLLVLALLGRSRGSPKHVVLTGIAVGQFFAAMTSLVVMVGGDSDSTRGLAYWLLGSLGAARWSSIALCAPVVLCAVLVAWCLGRELDALTFGADMATGLGTNLPIIKFAGLALAAASVAVVVASVGAIGFVGLIVPHAVRAMIGVGHRQLIPVTALMGAVFLPAMDLLARVAFGAQQVPVGVLTALVGVPVFLLLFRQQGSGTR